MIVIISSISAPDTTDAFSAFVYLSLLRPSPFVPLIREIIIIIVIVIVIVIIVSCSSTIFVRDDISLDPP